MQPTPCDKIKIIIADDHPIVREGLVQIISKTPDMIVIDEADDGVELMDKIKWSDVDVVVMDLDMTNKSGWEVMRQVKVELPTLPLIILSVGSEEEYAIECFRGGASGYLNKQSSLGLLVEAIRKVTQGGRFISPNLAEKLAFDLGRGTDKRPHETLSTREFQVFCMISAGKTVKEISVELSLSAATISTYRARILEKLRMKNNAQLTHYAFKNGILK